MRCLIGAALLSAGLAATCPAWATPVTEDAFTVRSTGDLVTLCGSDKTDPMYTAAQNFCHGFAVGSYTALLEVQQATRSKKKLFCAPATPPNRNDAIAAFVVWAGGHNDLMALPPLDGVVRFLAQQYPCK